MANSRLAPSHTILPSYHEHICFYLIRMHLHNQRFIFSHDTFQWVQHGDPMGLHILKNLKPLVCKISANLQNSMNFIRLCAKNEYKNYNMNSM